MRLQSVSIRLGIAALCAVCVLVQIVRAEAIPPAEIAELKVFPPTVNLNTHADRQSLIVQAVYSNELSRDVTSEAKITPANADLVQLDGNTIFPKADGKSELTIKFGGRSVNVPLVVKDAAADRPISFQLDVMPVFMQGRLQHRQLPRRGPRQGRFPPVAVRLRSRRRLLPPHPRDRRPAHQSGRARRQPADAKKHVGKVPHTGGKRFAEDSELLPDADALARGRRPATMRPDVPKLRVRGTLSDHRPCSNGKGARSK